VKKLLVDIANEVRDVSPILRETCLGAKSLFRYLAFVQTLSGQENRVALVFDVPEIQKLVIVLLNKTLNAKQVTSHLNKDLYAPSYVRVSAAAYIAVKYWHDRYRIPRKTFTRSTSYQYYLTVSKETPNYRMWSVKHGDAFRAYFAATSPCRYVDAYPCAPENVLNVSDFISGLTTYGEFTV
jgi:hypothetical protein